MYDKVVDVPRLLSRVPPDGERWKTRSAFERCELVNEDDLKRAAERVVDSNGTKTGQVTPIDEPRVWSTERRYSKERRGRDLNPR